MKIKMIFTNALIGLSSFAFGQQIVELSTGVVNGSSALIAPGSFDDTWTVSTPFNSSFVQVKCSNPNSSWATDANSRWVSPHVDASNNPVEISVPNNMAHSYTYKTTFLTSSTLPIKNATLTFYKVGADNKVSGVSINDNLSHTIDAGFQPLKSNLIIEIPANELNPSGLNTIRLFVSNSTRWTGLLVNGILEINYGDGDGGPDVTVCKGSCATLNATDPLPQSTYTWYISGSSIPIASGPSATVCPTVTTTYELVVATQFGTTNDQVTVFVQENNPAFVLTANYTPLSTFYTCFASPVAGLPNNGSYAWIVEEIVSSSNTTVISGKTANNPNCWWNAAPYNCDFHGYDGSRATVMDPACSNPTPGRFTAGHTYRITRGTWSNTCAWKQYSVIVYKAFGRGEEGIIVAEDKTAPDYSALVKTTGISASDGSEKILAVYPNPSNGIFTITANHVSTGTIEIYDMVGHKVETIQLKNNIPNYEINLTHYSKGIYFVNLISEGQKYTEKIIVE